MIIPHAVRQRGAYGNRVPGLIDPKASYKFLPTVISDCIDWIDFSDLTQLYTDAGSTQVASDGDAIYRAADQSGLGNYIEQTTSSYRPIYKTGIKNSLSIGRFDGSNDRMNMQLSNIAASDYSFFFCVGVV